MMEKSPHTSRNLLPKTLRIIIIFGIVLGIVNVVGFLAHALADSAYVYWGDLSEPIVDVVAAIVPAVDAISEPLKGTKFSDRIVLMRSLFSWDWILLIMFLVWGLRSTISEFSKDPDAFSRAATQERPAWVSLVVCIPFVVGFAVVLYTGRYLFPNLETIFHNDSYLLLVSGLFWCLFDFAIAATAFCAVALHRGRPD